MPSALRKLSAQEQIDIRKKSLRGAIDNFRRVLISAEKKAEEYRTEMKRLKSELLDIIENEDELRMFIDEVEGKP